ncbi:MAG: hypothetical protein ABI877_21105 [Gemmatimonadaceae bacterium]
MSARSEDDLALSGPPRNLTGFVTADISRSTVVPISITVGGQATIYRAFVRPHGNERIEIRLRLPSDTPPGVYHGEGTIDGKTRRVVVEVEPVMRIRVQPQQSNVTAAATSSVEFGFTVMNSGNVPFDVPKADVVDLDDAVGQDRALGRTLRAPLTQGERRIDRYFDELRESHGGEAHVAVRSGAGPLQPGESRQLTCLLDVPATAQVGRSYLGPWQLGNVAHVIVADIMASTRPENGRTKG